MSQACLVLPNGQSARIGDYVAFQYVLRPSHSEVAQVAMSRVIGLVSDGIIVAHPEYGPGHMALWKVARDDVLTLIHPSWWQRMRWRFR